MNQVLENLNLAFIGGGNMGQALVHGLLKSGCTAENVYIIDTNPETCLKLEKKFPHCHVFSQTEAALNISDVIILAVKPQVMQLACEQIAEQCQLKRPLVISIAAGIQTSSIDKWLGGELPIVRCMPNTPALVQAGTTGLFANTEVTETQRELADAILSIVGSTLWLDDEAMLDIVTAVSGSGPAYFFYLIEAMLEAGLSLGLSEDQARQLTIHTAVGAAKLIEKTGKAPQELRHAVTSKGGTTEAAISTLDQGNMKGIIKTAISNAAIRAKQLADSDTDKNKAG